MTTSSLESLRIENLNVVTSLKIDESNNAETNATDLTNASGLFLTPSVVAARPDDISGYIATAATEQGKVEWSSPADLGSSILLNDLSDVDLTAPVNGEYLTYDGTNWVNSAFPTVDLGEVSDVDLTAPANNEILTYDGTNWVNSSSLTLSGNLTVNGNVSLGDAATDTLGFYGATPAARPAVSTSNANFLQNGSNVTDGGATYDGYTVEGIVVNLRTIGLLS